MPGGIGIPSLLKGIRHIGDYLDLERYYIYIITILRISYKLSLITIYIYYIILIALLVKLIYNLKFL
jgi:hypothetical protein